MIEAFRRAREQVDCTLVLAGNNALDDPEGGAILETIHGLADERVVILTADDPNLVNALQRSAAVVLQKSTREGFGLTVTEAMWKGAAVIGGNVGGIRLQITDGDNGFLVNSVDEAAERPQVLRDARLRERLGRRAKETVRERFLMSRLIEDWIDLLAMLERRPRYLAVGGAAHDRRFGERRNRAQRTNKCDGDRQDRPVVDRQRHADRSRAIGGKRAAEALRRDRAGRCLAGRGASGTWTRGDLVC